jgi:hypothetical protein
MKNILLFGMLVCCTHLLYSQEGNPNTMTVMINGEEYTTEPRRIKIGRYGYITGNTIGPDKSLRIWLGSIDGTEIAESGTYLIIGEGDNDKDKAVSNEYMTGRYKGIAFVKYVEETKSPRMEYHVGESRFKGETIEAVYGDDGFLELTFDAVLDGTYWKEKATATVFGGLDRLGDKMKDKAVTSASGYDQNIDPEGNGYKKQKETDTITLTEGRLRLRG